MEHRALDGGRGEDRPLVGRQALERAASSAWIDEGTGRSARSDDTTQWSSSRVSSSSSISIATSSSAKSALPSTASAIRDSASEGAVPGRAGSRSAVGDSSSVSGSSRIEVAFSLPRPSRDVCRAARAARCRQQDRDVARVERDVLDQVEERRLRPVDVVEDDHQRAVRASASKSFRTAQNVSSLVPPPGPPSPSAAATRSAINSPPRPPASGDAPAMLARSWPSARATSRTTSASGQYVMPSP